MIVASPTSPPSDAPPDTDISSLTASLPAGRSLWPIQSAGAPNDGYRSEAVRNANTRDRDGDRIKCSCSPSPTGRNLVICIDGTANQFSEKNSNVVELYSRLVKDKDQLTYYNSGIGTYVKDSKSWRSWFSLRAWKQSFHHALDTAIASTFQKKVLSAYHWLSENYENGDRIFLFGFSRGAYQVRVIAGMIELVGLLHKGNEDQIPFAYELYVDSISNEKRTDLKDPKSLCVHFKQTLSRPDVKVHFVGAWDTVSSIGIFRGRSLPETTEGMRHVCAFRQALALDELRVKFLPEYANGGEGPKDAKHIKEVWFAGFHSDIGGGNLPNLKSTLFGPALRWMSYEAIQCGLKMQPHQGEWSLITPNDSMTGIWKICEYIPFPRLSYKNEDSVEWWPPHREHPRQVKAGQLIHESVLEELAKGYTPKALTSSGNFDWGEVLKQQGMIEKDPYAQAGNVLSRLGELNSVSDADVHVLRTLASSEPGQRSIIAVPRAPEILIASLRGECQRLAGNSELQPPKSLVALTEALAAFYRSPPAVRKDLYFQLRIIVSSLDTQSREISDHVGKLLQTLGTDLFALVIGIDKYKCGISSLTGCVADADDIIAFLTDSLGVPTDHIIYLRDEQATRINIIHSLLALGNNERISKNTPLLIYYAGYGSRVESPAGWMTPDGKIEQLLPHDFNVMNEGPYGIPDTTLAALLSKLAQQKGNNITVILDTCFSLGLSRSEAEPGIRGIQLPGYIPPDLDRDISIGINRGVPTLNSHVLLMGCSADQVAREVNGRGVFTQALTRFLRRVPTDSITYKEIIYTLEDLPGQNPQCIGTSTDCILFRR